MRFSPQRRAFFRHQNFQKCSRNEVFCTFSLPNLLFATAAYFFDIRTSKSALGMRCLVYFHFQICFSPQRRAFFRHQNFQKCSRNEVFGTFSLPNLLFATAACIFSTSELPKVLSEWGVLCIFTSKSAFRHSGVQFLTSPLTTWLRTRRFNRPTFGLDTRIIEKTQHFATSLTFGADVSSFFWLSRYCIFFLLTWLLYCAFQLSILSEVSI